jgi:beta-galactosidase
MLLFGGDYNPEQWDAPTWAEDVALMREARVNTATVGVFSWSWIEPSEGRYRFDWLDATLERLHKAGVSVILATPTASPPPWFSLAHPDALPVRADGTRLVHGSRDTYCAAAPSYRQAAVRVATKLAERYAGHPALAMWHVHNEYGTRCWCDHAAAAFRSWLQQRYGAAQPGLDELNQAWGTAFWGQRYGDWEEVLPPRATQWLANPSQTLDFQRFWSSELLSAYVDQRDAIRARTPGIPVTTNFMLPEDPVLDLWEWGRAVDVVAIDHYPSSRDSGAYYQIALAGDLARSLNQGRPWLVMEQAASTTVEDHGTVHRPPGRTLLDALAYIAHGSDSALFFQWRASRAGAEMFHSAMVPHAGADTRIFREMTNIGHALEEMSEVSGSTLDADVAIVFDFASWWALEARRVLSAQMRYLDSVRADHRAVTLAGHLCDFVPPDGDLSRYKLVIVSSTYVLSGDAAQKMHQYVQDGGCMIVSYLSGVVGSSGAVGLGGYPAVLRSLLGVRVEEFHPLSPGQIVPLLGGGSGSLWSERLTATDADIVDRYATGDLAGNPAITRRSAGKGCAWYISTRLCDERNDLLVRDALAAAGVRPVVAKLGPAVHSLLRRDGAGGSWQFWLNYGATSVRLPAGGYDLLRRRLVPAGVELGPGEAAVVRQDAAR